MTSTRDPAHWSNRAKEIRTLAESITDPEIKNKLLTIAADYEKIATNRNQRPIFRVLNTSSNTDVKPKEQTS
jgi:hypothetical protein